jgi:protein dithiol oxidoreductase (disulfide-forming)
MSHRLLALLALLATSVAACGRESAPAAGAPPTPQAAAAAPAPALAPAQASTPAEAASTPAPAASMPDADDAPEGTTSLELLAQLPPQHQLPDGRWKAGVNYTPVVPAQPTSVAPGKVEVLEVFWYACPHCYALEPYLQKWLKAKPAYVQFVRVPVMWGPVHRDHAKLYYTLQALGRSDLDAKVFDTIHNQQNLLVGNTPEETFAKQLQFAKDQGIDADAFRKAWNSFAVSTALQHADEITQRYDVETVPLIIVNGKYTTDVARAGAGAANLEAAHEDLIALIDDLTASEHRH